MAGLNLGRLKKSIERHLAKGWQRAVFARPGADPDETPEVVEGPGKPSDTALATLLDQAATAANEGKVKQTFIIDERTRVRIDARYGKAKVQTMDPETARKVMGGKDRALRPDDSSELLRTIGIMNADGTISTKHAKKYKQVNHFVEICRPALERLASHRKATAEDPLRIVDLACGNSYLSFVLAETLRLSETPAQLLGVDVREDVVERSRARAQQLGWSNLRFEQIAIRELNLDKTPDIVIALHACDTATDEAIALAVNQRTPVILAAPCCQRELAQQLDGGTAGVPALVEHGLLRREYAATLTDAIRAEVLDACGYKVDAVEFVASEHTAKNLLLRAHRRPGAAGKPNAEKLAKLRSRCDEIGVQPALLAMLERPATTAP